MSKALRFRQDKLPKQPGEIARLRVRKGADVGTTFILGSLPASIGRGEENEVVLADLKASRKHATINREPKGRWFIQDNGSANGILYRDKSERQFLLQHQTVFTVGETEFEILFVDLMPEVQSTGRGLPSLGAGAMAAFPTARGVGGMNSAAVGTREEPAKKKNLLLVVAAVGVALVLFQETEKKKGPRKKEEPKRDLASLLPDGGEGEHIDAGESIFRAGFREYREKNYLRAKTLFETVLQVSPGHLLAEKYLAQAENSIAEDIRFHLKKGREELNTGRLKAARGHYETVTRLLFRTPNAAEAIEAKKQIESIRVKMKRSAS